MAAITKCLWLEVTQMYYPTLVKIRNAIFSQGYNHDVSKALFVAGGSRRGFISLAFLASGSCLYSSAQGHFLHSKDSNGGSSSLHPFDLLFCLLLPLLRGLLMTLGLTQIIQDNFPMLSPFMCVFNST